jgi:hypothetical protein
MFQLWSPLNIVMNFRGHIEVGEFLDQLSDYKFHPPKYLTIVASYESVYLQAEVQFRILLPQHKRTNFEYGRCLVSMLRAFLNNGLKSTF